MIVLPPRGLTVLRGTPLLTRLGGRDTPPAPPAREPLPAFDRFHRAAISMHDDRPVPLSRSLQRDVDRLLRRRPELAYGVDTPLTTWIAQFEGPHDQRLAFRMVENFRYIDPKAMRQACRDMHAWLQQQLGVTMDETRFFSLGRAKSGGIVKYFYRQVNQLPDDQFLDASEILAPSPIASGKPARTLVMLDDTIVNGSQLTDWFDTHLGEKNLAHIRQLYDRIVVMTVTGMPAGLDRLRERYNKPGLPPITFHAHHPLEPVLSNTYPGFTPHEKLAVADMLSRYHFNKNGNTNKETLSPLGLKNAQQLLAFFYNTPDSTFPVFHADVNGWKPLFKRGFSALTTAKNPQNTPA
jgi:hypothetical protein